MLQVNKSFISVVFNIFFCTKLEEFSFFLFFSEEHIIAHLVQIELFIENLLIYGELEKSVKCPKPFLTYIKTICMKCYPHFIGLLYFKSCTKNRFENIISLKEQFWLE